MVVYVASFFTAGMVYGHYGMGALGNRMVLGLFLLDTSVMSYCCLCVNLAESVYALLVASVLGMCLADFISTPRFSVAFGIESGRSLVSVRKRRRLGRGIEWS
jgi:hypothetical protein